MTQQPAPPGTTSTVSGSTLAYLFADLFVLKEQPGKAGMKAFGTGEVVVTRELSAGLVAIALWQLREKGAVELRTYSAKRLGFISTSGVNITYVQHVETGGVEKKVLEQLQTSKRAREGRETAWDVANILCINSRDPRGTIIRMAIDEAVERGCLERVSQPGGTKLEPHDDRIQPLRPAAQELAIGWRDFRQGEQELAKLLRSTTFDGIEARVRDRRDDD